MAQGQSKNNAARKRMETEMSLTVGTEDDATRKLQAGLVGPQELAPASKELDSVVPGVGHSDEVSASRHGHAPRVVELSIPVSVLSEGHEEASLRSEDLDSVVVLVRHEQPVSNDIVGDSSGAVELSRSRSTASKGLDEVSFRRVDEDLVLKTIRNQNLETRVNKGTTLVKLRINGRPALPPR